MNYWTLGRWAQFIAGLAIGTLALFIIVTLIVNAGLPDRIGPLLQDMNQAYSTPVVTIH